MESIFQGPETVPEFNIEINQLVSLLKSVAYPVNPRAIKAWSHHAFEMHVENCGENYPNSKLHTLVL